MFQIFIGKKCAPLLIENNAPHPKQKMEPVPTESQSNNDVVVQHTPPVTSSAVTAGIQQPNNADARNNVIRIEPHEEKFDGRWRDESALKGIVKVEHLGAVKVEGSVKIKHEFESGDEENVAQQFMNGGKNWT
uniref:Uncharacterized protein n=1 Tax=Globodera pallida TaxID=36090 RepID=A0A183BRB8_GLOPA